MVEPAPCAYRDPTLLKGRVSHSKAPMRPTVTSIPHPELQPHSYYPPRARPTRCLTRMFPPFGQDDCGSAPLVTPLGPAPPRVGASP